MALADYQHTLRTSVVLVGVGLHTGERVRLTLRPAPVDTGVVFVRTDIVGDNRVSVSPDAVVKTQLGTVIANAAGATVSTIEHLMAALSALDVDNAVVELNGPEVPIMDGSALSFVQLIDRAGRRPQTAARRYIEILRPVEVVDGDKRAALIPDHGFVMDFEIAFASDAIGRQRVVLDVTEATFRTDLADCRTFGFASDVEALRAMGLARGGSLENAVVIDGDRVLNAEGLRRSDEFVRHKALDAIGDLYVLGGPIIGRFEGVKAGHDMNNRVVRALVANPAAWTWRTFAEELAEAV